MPVRRRFSRGDLPPRRDVAPAPGRPPWTGGHLQLRIGRQHCLGVVGVPLPGRAPRGRKLRRVVFARGFPGRGGRAVPRRRRPRPAHLAGAADLALELAVALDARGAAAAPLRCDLRRTRAARPAAGAAVRVLRHRPDVRRELGVLATPLRRFPGRLPAPPRQAPLGQGGGRFGLFPAAVRAAAPARACGGFPARSPPRGVRRPPARPHRTQRRWRVRQPRHRAGAQVRQRDPGVRCRRPVRLRRRRPRAAAPAALCQRRSQPGRGASQAPVLPRLARRRLRRRLVGAGGARRGRARLQPWARARRHCPHPHRP